MRTRRGVTFVEVLVAMVISAIITASLTLTFGAVVDAQVRGPEVAARVQNETALEDKLREIISAAWVDDDSTDDTTYFVASTEGEVTADNSATSPEITFTTIGRRVSAAYQETDETDFEARNEKYGPVGGATEVTLSTTAVGDAGNRSGLFLRQQSPSDSDDTQGGMESLLDSRITSISFEFFDGAEWTGTWDTTTGERRIPALVKVHYSLNTDAEGDPEHILTIRMRNSDVTTVTPYNATGTTGATG